METGIKCLWIFVLWNKEEHRVIVFVSISYIFLLLSMIYHDFHDRRSVYLLFLTQKPLERSVHTHDLHESCPNDVDSYCILWVRCTLSSSRERGIRYILLTDASGIAIDSPLWVARCVPRKCRTGASVWRDARLAPVRSGTSLHLFPWTRFYTSTAATIDYRRCLW